MKTSFVAILMMIVAVSCGKSSSKNKNVSGQDQLNGPLSYSFKEEGERSCQTGVHLFTDKEGMCMGLQSETINNSCATVQRFERFQKDCEPTGFRWYESAQCDLYVLKESSQFPGIKDEDVLKKVSICAGRAEGLNWAYIGQFNLSNSLYKGTSFEMSVAPMVDANESFKATLSVTNPDGKVIFNVSSHSNLGFQKGSSLQTDKGEKIQLNCYITDACRMSKD